MSNDIEIVLSREEAWVLFEFVRRFSDEDKLSIKYQAEQRALWNLCCIFEKSMSLESCVDYEEFMQECRKKLTDEE